MSAESITDSSRRSIRSHSPSAGNFTPCRARHAWNALPFNPHNLSRHEQRGTRAHALRIPLVLRQPNPLRAKHPETSQSEHSPQARRQPEDEQRGPTLTPGQQQANDNDARTHTAT
nr:hypothetical protein GCM10010200_015390 [Actinomadura rugatobispora]